MVMVMVCYEAVAKGMGLDSYCNLAFANRAKNIKTAYQPLCLLGLQSFEAYPFSCHLFVKNQNSLPRLALCTAERGVCIMSGWLRPWRQETEGLAPVCRLLSRCPAWPNH